MDTTTLYLHDLDPKKVDGLELDEEVTVVIKGKVRMVSKRKERDYELCCSETSTKKDKDKKKVARGEVEVEYSKMDIEIQGGNQFAELTKDD